MSAESPVENLTEAVVNATKTREPASPEGMIIAYGGLMVMALLPIYFGAFRSVRFLKKTADSGQKLENSISKKDAMLFPVIASVTLLSLYVVFKLVPKEYITILLLSYFFFLGVVALAHIVSPYFVRYVPEIPQLQNLPYHLHFTRGEGDSQEELVSLDFCTYDIMAVAVCSMVGLFHLWQNHWATNNIFGLAFCLNGIEIIHLSSFKTGGMLLGGLFFYDIFWVFKTDVMVTVAKSVEAPIKLMFPQDLLVKGLAANNCAMLGLGDIVIPGVFIALMLRYDKSLNRGTHTYFNTTFAAYVVGLLVTIFIMHVFKHAQPALLYLVPACLGVPTLLALIKGDFASLTGYNEEHLVKTQADIDAEQKKGKKSN